MMTYVLESPILLMSESEVGTHSSFIPKFYLLVLQVFKFPSDLNDMLRSFLNTNSTPLFQRGQFKTTNHVTSDNQKAWLSF
jgi:hypothetical protein